LTTECPRFLTIPFLVCILAIIISTIVGLGSITSECAPFSLITLMMPASQIYRPLLVHYNPRKKTKCYGFIRILLKRTTDISTKKTK